MRVLLIYPPCLETRFTDQDHAQTPIGLYYLASLLISKGFQAGIINPYADNLDNDGIIDAVGEYQPALVGFSVFNANRWPALDLCGAVKKRFPDVVTVFGGVAATFMWKHFLSNFSDPDYIIRGEGEVPLELLADGLAKGKLEPGKVPGLAWRKNGRPVTNPAAQFIRNLDTLPDPSRHFTFSHVVLSRGCPGECSFCASPRFWKRRIRYHSADYFVDQLVNLRRKGVTYFNVSDDTFTLNTRLIREVCSKIIDSGIDVTWAAISRVDRVDDQTLGLMRRAGCIRISFGVESGSPRIRKKLNKGFSELDVVRAFELCKKNYILPRAYFIYASPGEDQESIGASLEMIRKIKPLGAVFYILHLFPGTALYDEMAEKYGITDDIWLNRIEDISYHQLDEKMDNERVLGFGRSLRSCFYRELPVAARELSAGLDQEDPEPAADFFSRLGLTFIRGDYARIDEIPEKEQVGKELLEKSLEAAKNSRAYLGLGLFYQQRRDFKMAEKVLRQGLGYFSGSSELVVCLAVCLMNTGSFRQALELLLPFKDSPAMSPYIRECRKRLTGAD
jgi:anaerobic magnesium-protoporphyrin IX monomethyl ester cyclase